MVGLSGCAAKQFAAMPMVQPGDDALSCEQIKQQITDNGAAEARFEKEDKQVAGGNVAKVVAGGALVGPLAAGTIDLSNEEQVKARALADRNEHLAYLGKQKGCQQ
jgi:hypothetical protein